MKKLNLEKEESLDAKSLKHKKRGEISLNDTIAEKKKRTRKNDKLSKKKKGHGTGNHLGFVVGNKARVVIRPRILKSMINSIFFVDLINYLSCYIQCSKDKKDKLIDAVLNKPECTNALIVYMYKEKICTENDAYKKILDFVKNFKNDMLSLDEFFIVRKTKSFTKKHVKAELLPESCECLKKYGYL